MLAFVVSDASRIPHLPNVRYFVKYLIDFVCFGGEIGAGAEENQWRAVAPILSVECGEIPLSSRARSSSTSPDMAAVCRGGNIVSRAPCP